MHDNKKAKILNGMGSRCTFTVPISKALPWVLAAADTSGLSLCLMLSSSFYYLTFFSVDTSIPPTFSVNSLFQYTQCCLPFVQILAFCHSSLSNWYLKSTFWLSSLTSLTALSLTLFFCHLSLLSPCSFHFKLLLSCLSVLCPALHVLLSHDMSHLFSYSFCSPLCIFLHICKVFIY